MNISYSWGVPILYQECLYLFNKYNRLATDIKSESTPTVCDGISTITVKDSSIRKLIHTNNYISDLFANPNNQYLSIYYLPQQ